MFGVKCQNQNYDPALVSLFAQSLGAVGRGNAMTANAVEACDSSSGARRKGNGILSKTSLTQVQTNLLNTEDLKVPSRSNGAARSSSQARKRKRKEKEIDAEDDFESKYMSQLVGEESKEDQSRARNLHKRRQEIDTQGFSNADMDSPKGSDEATSEADVVTGGHAGSAMLNVPQHEGLTPSREYVDPEKSSRTVFLANVSTEAIKSKKAKRELMNHLTSFTSSLPPRDGGRHGIESLRFRSTAFAATGIPKKAAFVRKEIMDTTTKSTNAYVVYTSQLAAREAAARLNGSMVLDRHLRVDLVAHPAKIDHRKCVFVGNLGFVDDETDVKAAKDEENCKRLPKANDSADVEEGLWRQFEKAGIVANVRVVRDKTTRVGKGFAYIQFKDANSVEKALLYHKKKFPPMLPRILRVTRAKNTKYSGKSKERPLLRHAQSTRHRPKIASPISLLTGHAGAARPTGEQYASSSRSASRVIKSPMSVVFEGFRASSNQRKGTLKQAGSKHNKLLNKGMAYKGKGKKSKR